jgi:hypothetical protein
MPSPKPNALRHGRVFAAAAFAGLMLSGCAMSDDTMSSFLVAPGHFVLYSCPDLAVAEKGIMARQKELEHLIAKSGTDAGGRLIGDATYGPEYAQTRGQLKDLRQTAADKHCNLVPGADTAAVPSGNAKAQ